MAGNTIGCGIILSTQEIFFMVDGNFQGIAYRDVHTPDLYPTVSFHSPNEEVKVNFGKDPFKYDIESMIVVCLTSKLLGRRPKEYENCA